ncbi:receptor expression-enhancing protein [Anaeramoeba ignava]|uniref:Receptor expression-enhancing protein n=1 Tax=Anaeramoeba ignava TaxID=1746090 RepID=A0A9Q0R5K2_ANAIG|nr:receptor expression-enhancing protein [Anaeramoeba ignava]
MVIGYHASKGLSIIIAFLFPSYRSYKAVKTPDKGDDTEGSQLLWKHVVEPFLDKRSKDIDQKLVQATEYITKKALQGRKKMETVAEDQMIDSFKKNAGLKD